jgi:PPOX class probable F420-dependent enzyme
MPGYGVAGPDEGRGLLPWSWAQERIAAAERYWLVTVSPDGAPHVMPVWAIWHEAAIWLSTGGESRKARNLRREPRCALHVDGPDPVIVNGVAEIVADPGAIARMTAAYAAKYGEAPPDPGANPIVRVRPERVFGLVEDEFATSPTRWIF